MHQIYRHLSCFRSALPYASIHCMLTPAFDPATTKATPIPARSSFQRLLVIILLLLGFALRLYHLGGESLWYDETVSAYLAGQPLPELIAHTARDIHPPAYYLLLYIWR